MALLLSASTNVYIVISVTFLVIFAYEYTCVYIGFAAIFRLCL